MDDKNRKLFITLELVALAVSFLLVLIDYKLKRDLLDLFIKIERELYGRQDASKESPRSADSAGVRASRMVDHSTGVEAENSAPMAEQNGSAKPANQNGKAAPKRSTGARNQAIPGNGKPVGP